MRNLENRLDKAEQKFFGNKTLYCSKDRSLKDRLSAFCRDVIPCALHGADMWCFNVDNAKIVNDWEKKMLRRVVGLAKEVAEDFVTWAVVASEPHTNSWTNGPSTDLLLAG